MNTAFLVLLLVGASQCLAQGARDRGSCQAGDAERAVCAEETRLTDGLRRNDTDLLARIYAEDFQLINYRGTQVNKARVLDALRAGTLRFDSLTTSELAVAIYGGAAVVTGRQHQVAREPGAGQDAHPKDVRFTHVFVQTAGQWGLAVSQITPILAAALPN
jgi:ketosteroid isomerase-like protein